MPEALPEVQSPGIQSAPRLRAHTQRHFFITRKRVLGTGTENTWVVLISLSGNRLPDFCPAAALEPRDPWWQVFLSYASQVPTNRHPSLVDDPPSAERMVQVRGQN